MPITLEPLAMPEAQAFWRDKVVLGYGEFAKLSNEAKTMAFAVSGIAKGDELNTVYQQLSRALDEGIPFSEFKKGCADIFERRGWTGKRAWRIDNIFRTNIQTAYNVGHYKQLSEQAELFPYWKYSAINDSRTRPTHLAMNGRVWPADHPIWDTWYPPNGYRCRCSVIGITQAQADRRGLVVEQDDPTNNLIEPIDPVTGNKLPAQTLLPDPGFNSNAGKTYWQGLTEVLADKVEQWPADLRAQVLAELVTGPVFPFWLKNGSGAWPLAAAEAGAAAPIALWLPIEAGAELLTLLAERNLSMADLVTALAGPLVVEDGQVLVMIKGEVLRLLTSEQAGKTILRPAP